MFLQDYLLVKSRRILVPNSLIYQITRDFHNSDHLGLDNTHCDVLQYYWPTMYKYIQEYIARCETCLHSKHPNWK